MKKNTFTVLYVLILLICWISWTCKEDLAGTDPVDIVFPDSNVKYSQVDFLFTRTCALSGCHSQESMADGLSLATWQDARSSKPGVILAGDTANSRLIWRIEGTHGVVRMPLNRPPLTENQIKGLRTWIMEGAQLN